MSDRSSRRHAPVPVVRGDTVTIDVDRLGEGPDALGKVDDYVVFVPGLLPGERATVEITSAGRKHGRGEVVALRRRSADRIEPRCRHFLDCGGCHLQHLVYPRQLEEKRGRVERAVRFALGDDAPQIPPTVAAAEPYGQRHKVVLHLHNDGYRLVGALHRARSLDLVPVTQCPASQPRAFQLALKIVDLLARLRHRAWDPDFGRDGILRAVLVRRTTLGHSHVVIVAHTPEVPGLDDVLDEMLRAGATSISLNHNDGEMSRLLGRETSLLRGPERIEERLGGLRYLLSATSFFQTSPAMAWQLCEHVLDWLDPTEDDVVGDLYCGGGLLTLPLAQRAHRAFGIELSSQAVDDARAAAALNGIHNVTFRQGHVDGWLNSAVHSAGRGDLPLPNLIALDPPRTGLDDSVVSALGKVRAQRLAYVSCEPQALGRDLPRLQQIGYRTVEVTPFDMFPQTGHVEAVACLERVR